jgi:integrase
LTVPLVATSVRHHAIRFTHFNIRVWKPALAAAGMETIRENGCHALRHHFASVLLDGGESIKAVSEYLGHADAGCTLRIYTHLMPSSADRTRRVVDSAWRSAIDVPYDGSSVAKVLVKG